LAAASLIIPDHAYLDRGSLTRNSVGGVPWTEVTWAAVSLRGGSADGLPRAPDLALGPCRSPTRARGV